MTAIPLSQSEIVAELLEIQAERRRLDERETELLTLLQKPKKGTKRPVELTFKKNVITWEGGALPIRGKGYKFVRALYGANKMRQKVRTLGKKIWNNPVVKQHTFIVALHWLAEKLEKARFPYKLLPVRSQERFEVVERTKGKKPITKRIQSEIIGAKLGIR